MVIYVTITLTSCNDGNTFLPRPPNFKKIKKIMVVKKYFNAFFSIIEKKSLP